MFPRNILIDKKMFTCGDGFVPCWFILVFGKGPLYNVNKNVNLVKNAHIFSEDDRKYLILISKGRILLKMIELNKNNYLSVYE